MDMTHQASRNQFWLLLAYQHLFTQGALPWVKNSFSKHLNAASAHHTLQSYDTASESVFSYIHRIHGRLDDPGCI